MARVTRSEFVAGAQLSRAPAHGAISGLRYRISHRVALRRQGETPRLERAESEGDLAVSG